MNWKTIRLELGSTADHPSGSAGRAYLIRLPLDSAGAIDESALVKQPAQATVRRFWPSEADRTGQVERAERGWLLRCNGGANRETLSILEPDPLVLGQQVMITEPDGTRLPFRVASIRKLG